MLIQRRGRYRAVVGDDSEEVKAKFPAAQVIRYICSEQRQIYLEMIACPSVSRENSIVQKLTCISYTC